MIPVHVFLKHMRVGCLVLAVRALSDGPSRAGVLVGNVPGEVVGPCEAAPADLTAVLLATGILVFGTCFLVKLPVLASLEIFPAMSAWEGGLFVGVDNFGVASHIEC